MVEAGTLYPRSSGAGRRAAPHPKRGEPWTAPAFVWVGGDITLQGGKGAAYIEAVRRLKAPVRHVPGNHELHVSRPDPRDEYHARFGPTYYSFDVGRVHYVAPGVCLESLKPVW